MDSSLYIERGYDMISKEKEVRYDLYCNICKGAEKKEEEDPCDECLATPTNVDSVKPVNFKEQ